MSADHQPLESDGIPAASTSEALIAADSEAALRYLKRRGAMDVAEALGIAGAA